MKKLLFGFLAVLTLTFIASCSSDDDVSQPSEYVKAKIGNDSKTYSNVTVEPVLTGYVITAKGDSNNFIKIIVEGSGTGQNITDEIVVTHDGKEYFDDVSNATLTANISTNSSTEIKGSFTGFMVAKDGSSISITNGEINVKKK